MAQRVVFSDSSPLIGLSLVDGLGWLESLFGVVCITDVVADELLPGSNKPGEAGVAAAIAEGSIRIIEDVWTEPAFPTFDEAAVSGGGSCDGFRLSPLPILRGLFLNPFGSLGIAVGYPNILWSVNHYYPQEHPHDYPH